MARSSRRPMRKGRRNFKRPKPDWVYRGAVFDSAAGLVDDLFTYSPFSKVLVSGIANANASVLYDSHNYTAAAVSGLFDAPRIRVWAPSRAEGGRAFIHRVQGQVTLAPSVWAVGSLIRYGIRFGIWEQDAGVGAFLIDPAYSMWSLAATSVGSVANWANDRKWQRERRFDIGFSDASSSQRFTLTFNFSVRRALNPNECYGIYTEGGAGSVTVNETMWFRTLVSDEA